MKKLLFGAAAALVMLGAASCGNSDAQGGDSSKIFSSEASDSMTASFGELVGSTLNSQIAGVMERDSTITKEAFLKGLEYAFAADTTQAYIEGINLGLSMISNFRRFEEMGMKIDRKVWLAKFKETFLADSVPSQESMAKLQQDFQMWNDSLRNAKRNFDLREIENSPEARANLEAGKKYVDSVKKVNPEVKLNESGFAYKIDNKGEGKISLNDKVTLKVTGKALKGENPPSVPQNPINVNVLPKGLQNGVVMLGKGGKATFYIPGRQVYELDMAKRMGLEPNALIVYEVEVVDVATPESMAAPAPQIATQPKK